MNIGEMRSYITLQQAVRGSDGMGGGANTFTDVAALWANVKPISGKEYYEAQRLANSVTHKIKIRYDDRVKPKHRFTYGDRVFDIISVLDPDEKKASMVCLCIEKVS